MDSLQTPALFLCSQNLMVAFIQTFQCSLNELSHGVCEIRKITESPTLLLVKSCLALVNTLKQISNE